MIALVTAPFFVHLEMMFEVFGCELMFCKEYIYGD